MKSSYQFFEKEVVYFVTSTIVNWLPVFVNKYYFEIMINSIKFCQKNKQMILIGYVILDDHAHMILSALDPSSVLSSIKKFTARKIIEQLKADRKEWLLNQLSYHKKSYKKNSQYQVWQEGSHPKIIIDEKMLHQKLEYIHYNPVKRGLVDKPEHWCYSSARNYFLDDHSILKVEKLLV